jgi:DNA-binding CsgD family transcriptional regulator
MSCPPPKPPIQHFRLPPSPLERYSHSALKELTSQLTPRQVAVLAWVAHGATNIEIADQLRVGIKTVEGEVTKILRLLTVPTRLDAAVMWTLGMSLPRDEGPGERKTGNPRTRNPI